MIPAAGQGILAVQGRKDQEYSYLDGYCDRDAWIAGSAERAYVRYLDGGCSSPVAAFGRSQWRGDLYPWFVLQRSNRKMDHRADKGAADDGEKLGISLAKQLKDDCERGE